MAARSFSTRSRYHHGSCRTRYRRASSQGFIGLKPGSRNVSSVSLMDNNQELLFHKLIKESVQSEQKYMKDLEQLLMLMHHPGLQGNVLLLDEFIRNVKDLLSVHKNLMDDLTCNMCSVACAFFNFMPYMNFYLDYCHFLGRIHHSVEKVIGQCEKGLFSKCVQLLQAPIIHIAKYQDILKKLGDVAPEFEKTPLQEICDAVNKTIIEMTSICKRTENALKLLAIQKCLVDRQPKIFSPGRLFLKNETFYKTKKIFGIGLAERVLLLFSDILLCCKKVKKCDQSFKRNSLKCCAVIPLQDCSVMLAKQHESGVKWPTIKISWNGNKYFLFSKYVDVIQLWLEIIQEATRCIRESVPTKQVNQRATRSSLKRATVIRKKSHSSDNVSVENNHKSLKMRPRMVRQNCIELSDSQQLSETECLP